jgi:heme exporter protein CcmD
MDFGKYTDFILWSYAATFVAITGLIINAILAERMQQRALAKLEAMGIRRRSDTTKQKSAQ